MFARKPNTDTNTYGSTHLVCPTPEGNKYNVAVRWKLPAVTADWLKACADQLTLVDETLFLVGETMGKFISIKKYLCSYIIIIYLFFIFSSIRFT